MDNKQLADRLQQAVIYFISPNQDLDMYWFAIGEVEAVIEALGGSTITNDEDDEGDL